MVSPSRASKPTSWRKAWSNPPMIGFPSLNANEYPISAHVTVQTASAAMHIMKVLSVLLPRTRPA
jgi:hypothetical protein